MAAELSPSHVATDRNDEHEGNAQGQQLTHAVQSGLENLEYHGSVVFSIIDGIKEEIITLLDELKAASVSDLDRLKEFITQHCLEAAGAAQNHSTQTLHNVAQLDHIKSMVTKMVQDMAAGEQGEGRCEE